MSENIILEMFKWVVGGLYGAFGGFVHYLYQSSKDDQHPFSWLLFFINVIVAFFVGQVVWEFLPADAPSKGGIIMIAGFLAYPLLEWLERKGLRAILLRVFNISDVPKEKK